MSQYQQMYEFIREPLTMEMSVLEIGTGTGMIARKIADKVHHVKAIDASPKMIAEAKRIEHPQNIEYSVANAFSLPYDDSVFDTVIIANVLHIILDPDKVLGEIYRVLKPVGILIAPTFLWREITWRGRIRRLFMRMSGFPLYSQWDEKQYIHFLGTNHFEIKRSKRIKSTITLYCIQCQKKNVE